MDEALERRVGRRVVVLTASEFQDHVNNKYGDQLATLKCSGRKRTDPRVISYSTALRWLHVLGYSVLGPGKLCGAVFNDGGCVLW